MALDKIRRGQSFLTHARLWYLIDARDQVLGNTARYVAHLLMGKHKPTYHPMADEGDHIVVINTKHIAFTDEKYAQKLYRHYSGYPGGLKEFTAKEFHYKNPTALMWRVVYALVSKDRNRMVRMGRLHLFPKDEHPYEDRIYLKLKGPAPLPKRLDEYTLEEIKKYPKLF